MKTMAFGLHNYAHTHVIHLHTDDKIHTYTNAHHTHVHTHNPLKGTVVLCSEMRWIIIF